MRKRLATAVFCAAAAASASTASAAFFYEGFDYPAGNLGGNGPWVATTGTGDNTVTAGSLGTPITTSVGNSVITTATNGKATKMTMPAGFPNATGTLYYSMALKVDAMGTTANTTGAFVAGFNNTGASTSAANPTAAGARLQIRRSPTDSSKFNLGIRSDITAAGTSTLTYDTTDRNAGDELFVVGAYEFNSASNTDDVSRLWIYDPVSGGNMQYTDFGAASAPPTTLTSTGGDINTLQILSFFLRRNGSAPQTLHTDELRLATSWAEATTIPEPGSLAALAAAGGLLLNRSKRKDPHSASDE